MSYFNVSELLYSLTSYLRVGAVEAKLFDLVKEDDHVLKLHE